MQENNGGRPQERRQAGPKEEKKKDGKIKTVIKDANPAHLSREIAAFGGKMSAGKTMAAYLIYLAASIAVGILFSLHFFQIVVVVVAGLFWLPVIIKNSYKNKFEQQRFSDVSEYIEHFLYSFQASGKILKTLDEVSYSFRSGQMHDAILEAKEAILSGDGKNGSPEREGLAKIEEKYGCERLKAVHKFAVEVEYLGGEYSDMVDLLLEDRSMWVDRLTAHQQEKKSQRTSVLIAIAVSVGLCLVVQNILPSDTADITQSVVVRIGTVLLLLIDLVIYAILDSKLATDWLKQRGAMTDSEVKNAYKTLSKDPTSKSAVINSIVVAVIMFAAFAAVGLITGIKLLMAVGAVFAVISFFMPRTRHKGALKSLSAEMQIVFPQWLMTVALQLQSENVENAILNTIDDAPEVLKPHLRKLDQDLAEQPNSPAPYLDFLQGYDLPEVQSSMKMLYSLSAGTGGDKDKQICEIIHRNNLLLDKAEKRGYDNDMAGLYALMLAPQLSGGLKLLIDMVVFFMMFMNSISGMLTA